VSPAAPAAPPALAASATCVSPGCHRVLSLLPDAMWALVRFRFGWRGMAALCHEAGASWCAYWFSLLVDRTRRMECGRVVTLSWLACSLLPVLRGGCCFGCVGFSIFFLLSCSLVLELTDRFAGLPALQRKLMWKLSSFRHHSKIRAMLVRPVECVTRAERS
jgi:hypothetical protein